MKPSSRKKDTHPFLYLAPAIVFLALFMAYPIINVFYYCLHNYNINKPYLNGFVGLDNFVRLGQDNIFFGTIGISLKWVIFEVTIQLIVGMVTALILKGSFHGRGLVRALVFAPWAVSGVITSMLWSLIFNENMGVLNDILLHLGLISDRVAWISNYDTAFPALLIAELWRGLPFFSIMLLAGLQGIPDELYEASAVDGASHWKTFWLITVPQLKNTIILSTLLRSVWEFNNVDLIYNLTGGGPTNRTMTLTMYLTRTAVYGNEFGYGSAIAVVAFLFLAIFASLYIKLTGFGKGE